TRTPAVLPRRVHLPFQSAQFNRARNAVLPTPAAKRQHRSSPTAGTHQPQARGERRQRHQPRTHPQQYLQRVLITASPLKQISSTCVRPRRGDLTERADAATTCGGKGQHWVWGRCSSARPQVMIAVGALSRGKRECTYFRGRSGEKFTAEQIAITRIPAGGFHS